METISAETILKEREGLDECITVLELYCEEVYKDGILPEGVKVCIDKLKSKRTLVTDQIEWITRSLPQPVK